MNKHLLSYVSVVMAAALTSTAFAAGWTDGHSVESVRAALSAPISATAATAARDMDDKIMSQGSIDGVKVYLVTDSRQTRLKGLVGRLLNEMGEESSKWVVRVLDTDPKMDNAFVTGGKYIYVFTGLIDNAKSEDELAFVLGHELGHSLLKHNERRANDMSTTLANLATVVAALSKGNKSNNAALIGKALSASYSQDDEREADTFGVSISWRAGFDPIRGADFFTRMGRAADKEKADRDAQLAEYRQTVVELQQKCATYKQQWNSGVIAQSQNNANIVNNACNLAAQHAQTYNTAQSEAATEDALEKSGQFLSSHPMSQDRIAAISALTDVINGARPLDSLSGFQQPFRVMTALKQNDSILVQPKAKQLPVAATPSSQSQTPPATAAKADVPERLRQLSQLRNDGVITEAEYTAKRQQLLSEL